VVCQAASYGLAAYEALGNLLQNYSIQSSKDGKMIAFRSSKEGGKHSALIAFPIPEKKARAKALGSLSINDVFTVAIQLTMSIAHILIKLWGDSKMLQAAASVFAQWKESTFKRIGLEQVRETALKAAIHMVRHDATG